MSSKQLQMNFLNSEKIHFQNTGIYDCYVKIKYKLKYQTIYQLKHNMSELHSD